MNFLSISPLLLFIVLTRTQNLNDKIESIFEKPTNNNLWVPNGFELVSTTTLSSLKAWDKCGEGSSKGLKICVPYHRCDPITKRVIPESKGSNKEVFIDVRLGENDCESYLDVCCDLSDEKLNEPSTSTPQLIKIQEPSYCGIRNIRGLDFTLKGNENGESEYGEFPWVVDILKNSNNPNELESICGGSLLAMQVVLTGAHCVAKYKNNLGKIKVRAGEWDTLTEKERYPYQERQISEIIIHENFNNQTLAYDFALIFLQTPYIKAKNIGTICLPLYKETFSSQNCITGGWGKKEFDSKKYSNILKKIELPMVPFNRCQNEMRKTRLGASFNLHESFVCAGDFGKDSCTGDGGSPLICPDSRNPNRYVQVGIVAWGIGCGEVPGVYADVAGAKNWINAAMAKMGYNESSYTE